MFRKRTWMIGLLGAVLLTLSTGTHNDATTFSCTGSGSGVCTGDLCD